MILVPYVELDPRVVAAIPEPVCLESVAESETAYFEVLSRYWGQDLIVIEHDIVIHDKVIPEFLACLEPWCAFPYRHRSGQVAPALGCTRFRKELPDIMDELGAISTTRTGRNDNSRPKIWQRLDTRIHLLLSERGYKCHVHTPEVEHLFYGWQFSEVKL